MYSFTIHAMIDDGLYAAIDLTAESCDAALDRIDALGYTVIDVLHDGEYIAEMLAIDTDEAI